jgi:hypothetical protein
VDVSASESARSIYEVRVVDPPQDELRRGALLGVIEGLLGHGSVSPNTRTPVQIVDRRDDRVVAEMSGYQVAFLVQRLNADLDRLTPADFEREWTIDGVPPSHTP